MAHSKRALLLFAACLGGCVDPEIAGCHDGDLYVAGHGPYLDVTCVIGKVSVNQYALLSGDRIVFPSLTKVGGDLVSLGGVLIEARSLTSVAGEVVVNGVLDAPSLSITGGFTQSGGFGYLLEMPALAEVRGPFNVSDRKVQVLSFPKLTSVAGNFTVRANKDLDTLELPALKRVGGAFQVDANATLPQCQVDRVLSRLDVAPSPIETKGNDGTPNQCL